MDQTAEILVEITDKNYLCGDKTAYKSADEKTHDFNRVDDSPQIF